MADADTGRRGDDADRRIAREMLCRQTRFFVADGDSDASAPQTHQRRQLGIAQFGERRLPGIDDGIGQGALG